MVSIVIVSIIALIVGYVVLTKNVDNGNKMQGSSVPSPEVTVEGKIQKGVGDDYSYILMTRDKTIGVTSQTVDISKYENKNVRISGQYSGTTLYADSIVNQ